MFGKVRSGRSGLVGLCPNVGSSDKCMCPTGGYCEEDICGQNYQVKLEHNHRLSEHSFRAHSSNHLVLNEDALQTVDVLRKAGA
ncbi:hypothetical protein GQ600_13345 [Phytophthora cactorum]|nr:hypothetical protein GQ600_13345 [Phytophthora cactorum]